MSEVVHGRPLTEKGNFSHKTYCGKTAFTWIIVADHGDTITCKNCIAVVKRREKK